ncbi:hypothetical protein [Sphingomonas sp. URHD0057]|uniref:hypothetical protein n=1 Tax=Sphingomonas sp. URHD0057 TaxID=1380389 RepID=UPI000490C33A|nr:hypothetical protein [Sphingomonas sp. URHD0057]
MRIIPMTAAAGALAWAGSVAAQPPSGPNPNASSVQFSTGFVCPVISTPNVLHSPKGGTLAGGDYTIGGPDVRVPTHATNGDGTGAPDGAHSSPGDTDYSAIWSLDIDTC